MATNSESAVCLGAVIPNNRKETESLLPRGSYFHSTMSLWTKISRARRVRSKGAVLVIVWSLLTWACSTASSVNVDVIFQYSVYKIINGLGIAVLYLFAAGSVMQTCSRRNYTRKVDR